MSPERLLALFDRVADAPDAIPRLRRFVLDLALQGKLVKQDPTDEPASELLKRIASGKATLKCETGDRRIKHASDPQKDNYPISLPATWQVQCFGNLFLFIDYRGKTPPKTNDGIPLITAKNVRAGVLNREPREYINEATYSTWMTRGLPRIGDLFFTTEAPLGNVCQNDIEEPFALAQRVICLRPFGEINTRYLMFAIMSSVSQSLILEHSTGLTAKGIKSAKLKLLPIPVPPLEEQYRIAARVDELMALCNQLDEAQAVCEKTRNRLSRAGYARLSVSDAKNISFQSDARFAINALTTLTAHADQIQPLRQAILELAVRGMLVEQDPVDEPVSEALREFAAQNTANVRWQERKIDYDADKIRHIPINWFGSKVGEILDFRYGKGLKAVDRTRDGPVPVYGSNGIVGYTTEALTMRPSVIVGRKGSAGALNKCYGPSWTTDVAYFVEAPSFFELDFLYLSLAALDLSKLGKGVKPGLSRIDVYCKFIGVPPLAEQHRIVTKYDDLMVLCDGLEDCLDAVDTNRHRLLESVLWDALEPAENKIAAAG